MAEQFPLSLSWAGSTTAPDYPRALTPSAPGKPDLAASSGSAYGGDDARWNPEDLLGASLSACHTLTFLALAHKARLDVRSVDVVAAVTLEAVERVKRVTAITLSPRITLAAGDPAKAAELWQKAHTYCFIGNSITARVDLPAPEIVSLP